MKLILTITSGTLNGQKFELDKGFLTIGRSENCSIKFDPLTEKIASKQHAFVEAKSDGFHLIDNGSTNGTLVNGQTVQTVKLNSGDTIQFGKNGITAGVLIETQVSPTNEPTVQYESSQLEPTRQYSSSDQGMEQVATEAAFGSFQMPEINQGANPSVDLRQSITNLGLGSQNISIEPVEERKTGKYVGIAITLFAVVFLGLIVTGIMLLSLGPIAAVIAAVVAFTPAIIYLFPFIWLDRYDPEPLWLLSLAFAWGALVSVIISIVLNTMVGIGVSILIDPVAGSVAGAVIAAPFFEELSKGAGLLVVVLFFRKYFDGILDGIVFAGVIALGFATVENVLYYGRAWLGAGFGGLIVIFVMRGILSPFAHATFTAMTGIGFGIARESHNTFVKYFLPVLGLAAAMFLHAFWNGVAVLFGTGFFLVYFIIELPFFLIFIAFSFWIMWRQNKIIREMLAIDVARGLIPKEHFEKATSAFSSTAWLIKSIFNGKYKATNRYIRAIGKLGLSYWHIQRATAAQGQTASFQQNPILREEVLKWRDQV